MGFFLYVGEGISGGATGKRTLLVFFGSDMTLFWRWDNGMFGIMEYNERWMALRGGRFYGGFS